VFQHARVWRLLSRVYPDERTRMRCSRRPRPVEARMQRFGRRPAVRRDAQRASTRSTSASPRSGARGASCWGDAAAPQQPARRPSA